MSILVIDDAEDMRSLLKTLLTGGGHAEVITLPSAEEGYRYLGIGRGEKGGSPHVDLILTDIAMPGTDGIEFCKTVKGSADLHDIPVIMISAMGESKLLEIALDAGGIDYIVKPVEKTELLARVRSALRLKREIDERKARESELLRLKGELEAANERLKYLSQVDDLTGIANRRTFETIFQKEWNRALRTKTPLSLIFIDVDDFKSFNDAFGHQEGDTCLRRMAETLGSALNRSSDLIARYGGEEFVVLLPGFDLPRAEDLAESLRKAVESLRISHPKSRTGGIVTISLGVSSIIPQMETEPRLLIDAADKALYAAKKAGRNRVCRFGETAPDA